MGKKPIRITWLINLSSESEDPRFRGIDIGGLCIVRNR